MNNHFTKATTTVFDEEVQALSRDRKQSFERLLLPMIRAHGPCPVPVREALWSTHKIAWAIGYQRLCPPTASATRRMYRNWKRRKYKSPRSKA